MILLSNNLKHFLAISMTASKAKQTTIDDVPARVGGTVTCILLPSGRTSDFKHIFVRISAALAASMLKCRQRNKLTVCDIPQRNGSYETKIGVPKFVISRVQKKSRLHG